MHFTKKSNFSVTHKLNIKIPMHHNVIYPPPQILKSRNIVKGIKFRVNSSEPFLSSSEPPEPPGREGTRVAYYGHFFIFNVILKKSGTGAVYAKRDEGQTIDCLCSFYRHAHFFLQINRNVDRKTSLNEWNGITTFDSTLKAENRIA